MFYYWSSQPSFEVVSFYPISVSHFKANFFAKDIACSVIWDGRLRSYLPIGGPSWLSSRIAEESRFWLVFKTQSRTLFYFVLFRSFWVVLLIFFRWLCWSEPLLMKKEVNYKFSVLHLLVTSKLTSNPGTWRRKTKT